MPLVIQVTIADDGNVSVGCSSPAPLVTILGAFEVAKGALLKQASEPKPLVTPASRIFPGPGSNGSAPHP